MSIDLTSELEGEMRRRIEELLGGAASVEGPRGRDLHAGPHLILCRSNWSRRLPASFILEARSGCRQVGSAVLQIQACSMAPAEAAQLLVEMLRESIRDAADAAEDELASAVGLRELCNA